MAALFEFRLAIQWANVINVQNRSRHCNEAHSQATRLYTRYHYFESGPIKVLWSECTLSLGIPEPFPFRCKARLGCDQAFLVTINTLGTTAPVTYSSRDVPAQCHDSSWLAWGMLIDLWNILVVPGIASQVCPFFFFKSEKSGYGFVRTYSLLTDRVPACAPLWKLVFCLEVFSTVLLLLIFQHTSIRLFCSGSSGAHVMLCFLREGWHFCSFGFASSCFLTDHRPLPSTQCLRSPSSWAQRPCLCAHHWSLLISFADIVIAPSGCSPEDPGSHWFHGQNSSVPAHPSGGSGHFSSGMSTGFSLYYYFINIGILPRQVTLL